MEINDEPGVIDFSNLGDLSTGSEQSTSEQSFKTQDLTEVIERERGKAGNALFETDEEKPEAVVNTKLEDLVEEVSTGDVEIGQEGEGEDVSKVKGDTGSNLYKNIIKQLWGDEFETIVRTNEDGEDEEVLLDELDIDEEMFKEIYESQQEALKEKLTKDKISSEGISEFTKKLIEIDKHGGNVSEMLQMKQEVLDPLDSIDLDTPQGQADAVWLYYKIQGTKTDKEIEYLLKGYQEDGALGEVARQADSALREDASKRLEQEKRIAVEASEKRAEGLKSYKKSLRTKIDEKFELSDKVKSKIVDIATKVDNDNKFELDKMYGEYRRDPDKAAELILYMLDRDEFIKQITKEEVKKVQLNTSKKLRLVKRSPGDIDYGKDNSGKPRKNSEVLFDELK